MIVERGDVQGTVHDALLADAATSLIGPQLLTCLGVWYFNPRDFPGILFMNLFSWGGRSRPAPRSFIARLTA